MIWKHSNCYCPSLQVIKPGLLKKGFELVNRYIRIHVDFFYTVKMQNAVIDK